MKFGELQVITPIGLRWSVFVVFLFWICMPALLTGNDIKLHIGKPIE